MSDPSKKEFGRLQSAQPGPDRRCVGFDVESGMLILMTPRQLSFPSSIRAQIQAGFALVHCTDPILWRAWQQEAQRQAHQHYRPLVPMPSPAPQPPERHAPTPVRAQRRKDPSLA